MADTRKGIVRRALRLDSQALQDIKSALRDARMASIMDRHNDPDIQNELRNSMKVREQRLKKLGDDIQSVLSPNSERE